MTDNVVNFPGAKSAQIAGPKALAVCREYWQSIVAMWERNGKVVSKPNWTGQLEAEHLCLFLWERGLKIVPMEEEDKI